MDCSLVAEGTLGRNSGFGGSQSFVVVGRSFAGVGRTDYSLQIEGWLHIGWDIEAAEGKVAIRRVEGLGRKVVEFAQRAAEAG